MNSKLINTIKWSARVIALILVLFGLPFYLGYGNPLPFTDSDYSIWENIVRTTNLFVFVGLVLGWKFEKLAGYTMVIAILIGFFVGIATEADIPINILIAIIPGILFIISGHSKSK